MDLSVANSMDDVAESDHLFALADIKNSSWDSFAQGVTSDYGGKTAFIDADYFSGPWDTSFGNVGPGVAAHEFGHMANLRHSTGLMKENPASFLSMHSTEVDISALAAIYKTRIFLNQGRNYEVVPYYDYSKRKTTMRKMPNRGSGAQRFIQY